MSHAPSETLALTMKSLDAIFFDFDGVIADSVEIKANAFISLFGEEYAAYHDDIRCTFYEYTGRSRQFKLEYIYEHILSKTISNEEVVRLSNIFADKVLQTVINCHEISGANKLLDAIPSHIKTFVVSGTTETELVKIVKARHPDNHFNEVKGTPVKKEINIQTLIKKYQLKVSNCLMVGDGKVDQYSAQYNNMPFIGVVSGKRDNPFEATTPVVENMTHLHQLLIAHQFI